MSVVSHLNLWECDEFPQEELQGLDCDREEEKLVCKCDPQRRPQLSAEELSVPIDYDPAFLAQAGCVSQYSCYFSVDEYLAEREEREEREVDEEVVYYNNYFKSDYTDRLLGLKEDVELYDRRGDDDAALRSSIRRPMQKFAR